MKIVVIEGDKASKDKITEEIKLNDHFEIVFQTSNLNKGMRYLAQNHLTIDVLFLDLDLDYKQYFEIIQEYSILGMDLILSLTEEYSKIKELFNFKAKDCLQKTFTNGNVVKVLKRLIEAKKRITCNPMLFESYSIYPYDILYVQYIQYETQATLLSEKNVKVTLSLNEWENKLKKYPFYRINANYLINLNHIAKLRCGYPWNITMKNDKILMAATPKRAAFHKAFKKFLSENSFVINALDKKKEHFEII